MKFDFNNFQNLFLDLFIFITYLVYILLVLGYIQNVPAFLNKIDSYLKIYISLFLLWRFNRFRKIECTELDRKIVFSSGLFLLTTTAINQFVISYLKEIKMYLGHITII